MHKNLNSIVIFVAVADLGGFSKAAEKLGLTNSVVSHHISKLEDMLGVTLLYRSTRQVSLSDQGRLFYSVASKAINALEGAVEDLLMTDENPSGSLHIAMPAFMPDPRVEQLIWDFAGLYPKVEFVLNYSDDRQDLISGGLDIAFRLGTLESSSMSAIKLSDIQLVIVASPEYLLSRRELTKPDDLNDLEFIDLKQLSSRLTLSKGRVVKKMEIGSTRIKVDNIHAARNAAVSGFGLSVLPFSLCEEEIEQQKLVRVLFDWQIDTIPLFAVWNNKARRNSLTRRLITFLTDARVN